jgi:hypothetical protein
LTQRPLTATELAKARHAYQLIGECYPFTNAACELVDASNFLSLVVGNRTTDGKPLRTERVPTAADIGKRVRCKDYNGSLTNRTFRFAGFMSDGSFVTESECGTINTWRYCMIDEEATQ